MTINMQLPNKFLSPLMSYPTMGATTAADVAVTAVDCQKQVRSWRILRSLAHLLIPTCHCTVTQTDHNDHPSPTFDPPPKPKPSLAAVTGTIFGHRRGKVSFCLQTSPKSADPYLLLELPVPTTTLAREMRGGSLRIALQCAGPSAPVLSSPAWTMFCNGRNVGYAVKRCPSKAEAAALRLMGSVNVGAGIIGADELDCEDEVMYLRASFENVSRSSDSESFHLIDPDGNIGQELSIFFFRS